MDILEIWSTLSFLQIVGSQSRSAALGEVVPHLSQNTRLLLLLCDIRSGGVLRISLVTLETCELSGGRLEGMLADRHKYIGHVAWFTDSGRNALFFGQRRQQRYCLGWYCSRMRPALAVGLTQQLLVIVIVLGRPGCPGSRRCRSGACSCIALET